MKNQTLVNGSYLITLINLNSIPVSNSLGKLANYGLTCQQILTLSEWHPNVILSNFNLDR